MKDRFMKNGVFSLEYDKETLKDMVLELQEENELLKENRNKTIEHINKQIYYLEQQKRMLLNSGRITPQNGGIIAELKYKIKEYQDLLDILGGSK